VTYANPRFRANLAHPYCTHSAYQQPAGLFAEILQHLSAFGVSPGVIWLQLCGVISLLSQGVADVLWPNGQRAPTGVSGVLVGLSGTGKSLIYKLLMEAVEEHVAGVVTANPSQPVGALIEEATPSALIAFLKEAHYGGLFSEEAGGLAHLQGAAPLLAKLTDGAPVRQSRKSTGHVQLAGHRLAVLQLLQPWAFEKSRLFSTTRGQVGLINRFMVAMAASFTGSPHGLCLPDSLAGHHRTRTHELLDASLRNARVKLTQLPALQLSPNARKHFEHASEEIRLQVSFSEAALARHAEYVSRHPERILRLAGAIHVYNHGLDGLAAEISLDTMQMADQIGRWSIEAYQQLAYKPTQAQKDAMTIEQALRDRWSRTGIPSVRLLDLRRSAANLGLTRQRIEKALPELTITGRAQIVTSGGVDHLSLVFATPYRFPYGP
jgi:hypothetical protein